MFKKLKEKTISDGAAVEVSSPAKPTSRSQSNSLKKAEHATSAENLSDVTRSSQAQETTASLSEASLPVSSTTLLSNMGRDSPLPDEWQTVETASSTQVNDLTPKPSVKASPALTRSPSGRGSGGMFKKMKSKVAEQDKTGAGAGRRLSSSAVSVRSTASGVKPADSGRQKPANTDQGAQVENKSAEAGGESSLMKQQTTQPSSLMVEQDTSGKLDKVQSPSLSVPRPGSAFRSVSPLHQGSVSNDGTAGGSLTDGESLTNEEQATIKKTVTAGQHGVDTVANGVELALTSSLTSLSGEKEDLTGAALGEVGGGLGKARKASEEIEAEIAALKYAHSKELDDLRKLKDEEIASLRSSLLQKREIANRASSIEQELTTVKEKLKMSQTMVKVQESEREEALDRLRAEKDTIIRGLREEHLKAISAQKAEHRQLFAQRERQHVTELERGVSEALAKAEKESAKRLNELGAQLREAQQDRDEIFERMRHSKDEALNRMEESHREEVVALKVEVSRLGTECDEKASRVDRMCSTLEERDSALERAQQALDERDAELNHLLLKHRSELESTGKELSSKDNELVSLRQVLEDVRRERSGALEQGRVMSEQLSAARQELIRNEEKLKRFDSLNETLSDRQREINELHASAKSSEEELMQMRQEKEHLKTAVDASEEALRQATGRFDAERRESEKRNNAERSRLEEELSANYAKEMRDREGSWDKTRVQLEAALEALQLRHTELENSLAGQLSEKEGVLLKSLSEREKDLDKERTSRLSTEKLLEQAQASLAVVKDEHYRGLQELNAKIESLTAHNESMLATNSRLQKERDVLEEKFAHEQAQLKTKQTKANNEIEDLRMQLNVIESSKASLTADQQERDELQGQLRSEMALIKVELSKAQQTIDLLQTTESSLKADLRHRESEVKAFNERATASERNARQMETEMAKRNDELASALRQLDQNKEEAWMAKRTEERHKREIDGLQAKLLSAEDRCKLLSERQTELSQQLAHYQDLEKREEERFAETKCSLEEESRERAALEEMLEQMEEELKQTKDKVEKAQQLTKDLYEQLQEANEKHEAALITSAENAREEAELKLIELKEQNADLLDKYHTSVAECERVKKEVRKLHTSSDERTREVASLRQQLSTQLAAVKAEHVEEMEVQNREHGEELRRVHEEFDLQVTERQNLLDQSQHSLIQAKAELSLLKEELKRLEEQVKIPHSSSADRGQGGVNEDQPAILQVTSGPASPAETNNVDYWKTEAARLQEEVDLLKVDQESAQKTKRLQRLIEDLKRELASNEQARERQQQELSQLKGGLPIRSSTMTTVSKPMISIATVSKPSVSSGATAPPGPPQDQALGPSEFQYFQNILFQYLMGNQTQQMAKVLMAMAQLDEKRTNEILTKGTVFQPKGWFS